MFSKFFGKKEKEEIPKKVISTEWFKETEEGYGATRLRKLEDGTFDLVWFEESDAPYGQRFSSREEAMDFLGEFEPWEGLAPNWQLKDKDVSWD